MPPGPFLLIITWCCMEEIVAWTSQGLQQLWKACLLGTMMRNHGKGESRAQFLTGQEHAAQAKGLPDCCKSAKLSLAEGQAKNLTKGASRARSYLNQPGLGQSHVRTSGTMTLLLGLWACPPDRPWPREASQARPLPLPGHSRRAASRSIPPAPHAAP